MSKSKLDTPEKRRRHYEHTKKSAAANPQKVKAIQARARDRHRLKRRAAALARIKANPERHREYQKKWRSAHRERSRAIVRRSDLIRTFGINPEQYDAMLRNQSGRCAICKEPPGKRRLAIDHDHSTGRLRDLLCSQCNTMLGKSRDSVALLRQAIEYLERHANVAAAEQMRTPDQSMLPYQVTR